jgi:prepilin-type N-terminal cleavage/methylation domain-containing protein
MTLLEVMIALAILAVGASGAISTVVYSSRSLGTGQNVERATVLAQSLLSALMAAPSTAQGSGASASPKTLFTNTYAGVGTNDDDVADSANAFTAATLAASKYDHAESELTGTPFAALVAPLPTGFERYWNIAPVIAGSANGVVLAVIVRWREGTVWRRTVVVGTRYFP